MTGVVKRGRMLRSEHSWKGIGTALLFYPTAWIPWLVVAVDVPGCYRPSDALPQTGEEEQSR